jgi:hypothetical protein
MKDILDSMQLLTPKLHELESQMANGNVSEESARDLLGANPQLGFSKLVEFKAAIDRMRSLTWVYMEAAASATRLPAQGIPPSLKAFLQQQATKADSGRGKKSR